MTRNRIVSGAVLCFATIALLFLVLADVDSDDYYRDQQCVTHIHHDRSLFHKNQYIVERFCKVDQ